MKITPLTSITAVLVIGAAGFMAGRISFPESSVPTTGKSETSARPTRANFSSDRQDADTTKHGSRRDATTRESTATRKDRIRQLETIVRGEDPLDRNRALLAYIDQLGSGDFEEAISHFRSLGITESRMGEYAMLLSAWAKADPYAALEYAKANTNTPFATQTILATWAATDPESAIRWAETNHNDEGANPYMAGIIRSLAASDPVRATALLTSMPRSQERGAALDAMLPHLLRQGADATRSWIESLTDESLKNGAMMRTADQLAATDPAGTVDFLLANPSEATQRRMDDVYSVWARQDRQAALGSLSTLTNSEARSNALRGIVTSVAMENPGEAVSLMNRYPADVNDRVVQTVVWHSMGQDPVTAVNQIARISDEGQRNQMYRNIVGRWIERDAAAAGAWLGSSPMPDNIRQDLQRHLSRQQ